MSSLVEKLFFILDALESAGIPHAVGGAIALAFCTRDGRVAELIGTDDPISLRLNELVIGS